MPSNIQGESTYSSDVRNKIEEINPFTNLSINIYKVFIDKLTLSTGLHYSNEKAFQENWITIKAGFKF